MEIQAKTTYMSYRGGPGWEKYESQYLRQKPLSISVCLNCPCFIQISVYKSNTRIYQLLVTFQMMAFAAYIFCLNRKGQDLLSFTVLAGAVV